MNRLNRHKINLSPLSVTLLLPLALILLLLIPMMAANQKAHIAQPLTAETMAQSAVSGTSSPQTSAFTLAAVGHFVPKGHDLSSSQAEDNRIPTGDGQATVTATVLDEFGQPISDAVVTFSTDFGELSAASATTNAEGIATTTFIAGDMPGQATIMAACCDDFSQSMVIRVETPAPTALALQLGNSAIKPGTQTLVTATVHDQFNRPMSGTVVTFQSTLETLSSSNGVTDNNGQVNTTFTAGPSLGEATITALAETTSKSAHIQIAEQPISGGSIYLPLVQR